MKASKDRMAQPESRSSRLTGLSCRFSHLKQGNLQDLARRILPLLFFFLLGVGLYHQALTPEFPPHHIARLPSDKEVVISGRLCRPTRVTAEGVRLYVAAEAWKSPEGWRPATGKFLVTAPRLEAPPLGTLVYVRGKLREPQALRNPGVPDRPRQLAAEGIYRQMHVKDPDRLVFVDSGEAPSLAESLRGGVRSLLRDLPPDLEAIYLSMLLGDQGKVTPEMRQNLSRTGTSHLLVINGMHLGAVATVTYGLVFWLLRRFPWLLLRVNAMKIATLAAALPVVGYAHLAGGSPSTQRAEIMVLAFLLLMFLGRFRDVWSALALAAFLILLWSPLLMFSVSFQLSFAAVAGIVCLGPPLLNLASAWLYKQEHDRAFLSQKTGLRGQLQRLGWRGVELLAVSLAASLATAPLVAHHFQVVSLFGFLVNVAAIPLVLMMALPLGELAVLAQGFSLTPVARFFLEIGQIPLQIGYLLIAWVAGLPGSGVAVPGLNVSTSAWLWLQVGLMYAAIFFLFLQRRTLLTWAGLGLSAIILAFSLSASLWWPSPSGEITILDSRTGLDGVLVAPEGQRLAVTAAWDVWPGYEGGGPGPLPAYLRWRQFDTLDAVLALSLNARNASEILTLAQRLEVGRVWWKGPRPAAQVIDLMNLLGDAGRPGLALEKMNPPQHLGKMHLAYLSWGEGWGLALKVSCQGCRVLILPPLKRAVAEALPWLEENPLTALIAPREVSAGMVQRLSPEKLILYGSRDAGAGTSYYSRPNIFLTQEGAVTLTCTAKGAALSQWRP